MSVRTISPVALHPIPPDPFATERVEPQAVVLHPVAPLPVAEPAVEPQPIAPLPVAEPAVEPQPVALHKDPFVIGLATNALHDLTDLIPSVRYATVLTEDGFEVDGVPADEEDRLSSMASSIQGLIEAVARELTIGRAQFVIIATDGGNVIQLRVPGQQLVLAAVFELAESLGDAHAACRYAADRFATALGSRDL
jgi:predicted regulator of Ras-like GTPase activity (Roadblock/LC7/MglB family)